MSEELKTKDFNAMSKEKKVLYLETWTRHQLDVASTVGVLCETYLETLAEDINFKQDFAELTHNDEELAAHLILDVHEFYEIYVKEEEIPPYSLFDSLYDFVLYVSVILTDRELGYQNQFSEELEVKEF